MSDTYATQGLTVIAVDLDGDPARGKLFLQAFHPSFQIRYDTGGELAEIFHVKGMPTSVLIDRHGIQRFSHIGFLPADVPRYEAQLRELLSEGSQ